MNTCVDKINSFIFRELAYLLRARFLFDPFHKDQTSTCSWNQPNLTNRASAFRNNLPKFLDEHENQDQTAQEEWTKRTKKNHWSTKCQLCVIKSSDLYSDSIFYIFSFMLNCCLQPDDKCARVRRWYYFLLLFHSQTASFFINRYFHSTSTSLIG